MQGYQAARLSERLGSTAQYRFRPEHRMHSNSATNGKLQTIYLRPIVVATLEENKPCRSKDGTYTCWHSVNRRSFAYFYIGQPDVDNGTHGVSVKSELRNSQVIYPVPRRSLANKLPRRVLPDLMKSDIPA